MTEPVELQNNHLVYASGKAKTKSAVKDPLFGILLINTVKIKRTVEMNQWTQSTSSSKENDMNGIKYSLNYSEEDVYTGYVADKWEGLERPTTWPCMSDTFYNPQVDLGKYQLSKG